MGTLTYDGLVVSFEDRLLAHLQLVIVHKLMGGTGFAMSWRDTQSIGDGRSCIWLHPSIPLYFKFVGGRVPTLNRVWIAQLSQSADGSHGLVVTEEPER